MGVNYMKTNYIDESRREIGPLQNNNMHSEKASLK